MSRLAARPPLVLLLLLLADAARSMGAAADLQVSLTGAAAQQLSTFAWFVSKNASQQTVAPSRTVSYTVKYTRLPAAPTTLAAGTVTLRNQGSDDITITQLLVEMDTSSNSTAITSVPAACVSILPLKLAPGQSLACTFRVQGDRAARVSLLARAVAGSGGADSSLVSSSAVQVATVKGMGALGACAVLSDTFYVVQGAASMGKQPDWGQSDQPTCTSVTSTYTMTYSDETIGNLACLSSLRSLSVATANPTNGSQLPAQASTSLPISCSSPASAVQRDAVPRDSSTLSGSVETASSPAVGGNVNVSGLTAPAQSSSPAIIVPSVSPPLVTSPSTAVGPASPLPQPLQSASPSVQPASPVTVPTSSSPAPLTPVPPPPPSPSAEISPPMLSPSPTPTPLGSPAPTPAPNPSPVPTIDDYPPECNYVGPLFDYEKCLSIINAPGFKPGNKSGRKRRLAMASMGVGTAAAQEERQLAEVAEAETQAAWEAELLEARHQEAADRELEAAWQEKLHAQRLRLRRHQRQQDWQQQLAVSALETSHEGGAGLQKGAAGAAAALARLQGDGPMSSVRSLLVEPGVSEAALVGALTGNGAQSVVVLPTVVVASAVVYRLDGYSWRVTKTANPASLRLVAGTNGTLAFNTTFMRVRDAPVHQVSGSISVTWPASASAPLTISSVQATVGRRNAQLISTNASCAVLAGAGAGLIVVPVGATITCPFVASIDGTGSINVTAVVSQASTGDGSRITSAPRSATTESAKVLMLGTCATVEDVFDEGDVALLGPGILVSGAAPPSTGATICGTRSYSYRLRFTPSTAQCGRLLVRSRSTASPTNGTKSAASAKLQVAANVTGCRINSAGDQSPAPALATEASKAASRQAAPAASPLLPGMSPPAPPALAGLALLRSQTTGATLVANMLLPSVALSVNSLGNGGFVWSVTATPMLNKQGTQEWVRSTTAGLTYMVTLTRSPVPVKRVLFGTVSLNNPDLLRDLLISRVTISALQAGSGNPFTVGASCPVDPSRGLTVVPGQLMGSGTGNVGCSFRMELPDGTLPALLVASALLPDGREVAAQLSPVPTPPSAVVVPGSNSKGASAAVPGACAVVTSEFSTSGLVPGSLASTGGRSANSSTVCATNSRAFRYTFNIRNCGVYQVLHVATVTPVSGSQTAIVAASLTPVRVTGCSPPAGRR